MITFFCLFCKGQFIKMEIYKEYKHCVNYLIFFENRDKILRLMHIEGVETNEMQIL